MEMISQTAAIEAPGHQDVVLDSTGSEFIFFLVAGTMQYFGFSGRIMLVAH